MTDPIALVTGGTRGIGRAVAAALAATGTRVVVHGRADLVAAQSVAAALPGERHGAVVGDLQNPSVAVRVVTEAEATVGPLGILVNNAGIYDPLAPTAAGSEEFLANWERHLAVNLTGPALLIHAALPSLRRLAGRIVNVSSRGAFRGEADCPVYGAAKAGLNSLTQSLAVALAPDGVACFAVAPGWVETDMTRKHLAGPEGNAIRGQSPLGRVSTAAEVADVVRFCALEAPVAMTGAVIDINGASYLRS